MYFSSDKDAYGNIKYGTRAFLLHESKREFDLKMVKSYIKYL